MDQKRMLIVGAGNMAQPVILSLLKQQLIAPENLTIITGKTAGKNKESLLKFLKKNNIIGYDGRIFEKTRPAEMQPQDIVLYAAKPDAFEKIAEEYRDIVSEKAQVISIAAAIAAQDFKEKWGQGISVIRTMPHLPRRIYGIYADSEVEKSFVKAAFKEMGAAVSLANEQKEFHRFSAHAGCGPAFIAQFVARLSAEGHAASSVLSALEGFATTSKNNSSGMLALRVQRFFKNWQRLAGRHFPDSNTEPRKIVNQTILSTIQHLYETGIAPEVFAQQVRSARGVTNAGLLLMGSAPPNEPAFGDEAELLAQNDIATRYRDIPAEDSIIYALLAAEARSAGMAEKTTVKKHPLYLAGNKQFSEIAQASDEFLK